MKIITAILRRAAVFAAVLTVLWAALTAAAALPNELIYDNMLASALYYKDKEPFPYDSEMRLMEDNHADPGAVAAGLAICAVVFGSVFYLFRSSERSDRSFDLTMLILGVLPFARFFLLNNHSYLHEFFTYRALASTILAFPAVLWYSMDFCPKKKKAPAKGGKKHGRN